LDDTKYPNIVHAPVCHLITRKKRNFVFQLTLTSYVVTL